VAVLSAKGDGEMRIRLLGALVVCMLAAVLTTGAAGSHKRDVVIKFSKECPEYTCWETPGSPVEVDTTIVPVDFEDPLFHYTSVETLTSAKGSVTISLVGVLDLSADPNETVVKGFVVRGTWKGQNLAGASVYVTAHRVGGDDSHVFAGTIKITPGR
jgi:hypothetical protein